MLLIAKINSQNVCQGNLGENIFSVGDFGSGPENVVSTDPNIAPGYVYTTNTPPNDGFYTITNDMGKWGNFWGTWLRIADSSSDPDGYMMVVNASYEPGIFYEEKIDGLCENTLYEFSALVINLIRSGVADHIQPNVSFLLDGAVKYNTGGIVQDEKWHKYGFTFTTDINQTSVILTLRNNAPGGIGNDLALDNISFRPCGPDAFANAEKDFIICSNDITPVEIIADTDQGAAIQWQFLSPTTGNWENIQGANNNITYHNIFDPGEYKYRYLSAGSASNLLNDKCSVISDTATVNVLPIEFEYYDTICQNVKYQFGQQEIFASGLYEETFVASSGCDSFVDLYLTVVPEANISFETEILNPNCFGASDGLLEVKNTTGGTPPLTYKFGNETNLYGDFSNISSGNYVLMVTDRYQCSASVPIVFEDPDIFYLDLGPDVTVNLGSQVDLIYETNYGINTATWIGENLDCNICITNFAKPFDNGLYTVTAENEFGCIDSDSLNVVINEVENQFYTPNVFSPNEDGINDVFEIFTSSLAIDQVQKFMVFDRWGNKVYEALNKPFGSPDLTWDGNMNSNKMQIGVYSYFFEIKLINDDTIKIKGEVSLIR